MDDIGNLEVNAFYSLCRLCALKSLSPVFEIFSEEGILRELKKKIENCLHFSVDEMDKYPKILCSTCLYKLDFSYEFLLKSLESQQFLNDLVNHEVFDVMQDELQNPDLCLVQLNEIPDSSSTIQVLEQLVSGTHTIHADNNDDITQIIQYHDGDGEINDEEIQNIHQLNSMAVLQKDTDSLSDIGLYSFDSISDTVRDSDNENDFLSGSNFQHNVPTPSIDIIQVDTSIVNAVSSTIVPDCETVTDLLPINDTISMIQKFKQIKCCEICQKTFGTNYKLAEHMKKHSTDAPFKCSHSGCNKSFRSKIGLIQHEANKHTGQFKYACDICGKGFQVKSYLTIHLKVHSDLKPYKCSICGIYMKAKQALVDHENRHTGIKAFQCTQCDQKFISKSLCQTHEKTHAPNNVTPKYPCLICNKLFVRRAYLKTHMTIHNNNKKFICDVCGNKFLTACDLKLHAKTHTGEKGYVCEICGKAFIRPDGLNVHKRTHVGERPYSCKFCGQQFAQISSMKIHENRHL